MEHRGHTSKIEGSRNIRTPIHQIHPWERGILHRPTTLPWDDGTSGGNKNFVCVDAWNAAGGSNVIRVRFGMERSWFLPTRLLGTCTCLPLTDEYVSWIVHARKKRLKSKKSGTLSCVFLAHICSAFLRRPRKRCQQVWGNGLGQGRVGREVEKNKAAG